MDALNTFVFLMFIAVLLVGLAQKLQISYPIALILGGSVCGFIPGLTPIDFDPKILFIIVLPPILFYASYNISFRAFIKYFSEIFSLAIWLVIATTVVVALIFKWLFPELSWALAFAFGAIISPPDAVAATAILKRFSINKRLETILEGESLINDASALVIYRFAVIALLTGTFSLKTASFELFYLVGGGILIGIICGYILNKISKVLNPVLSVVYSFSIPYVTYCIADFLGMSGILAVVSCGLLGARMLITQFNPLTRVLGWASWDIVIILLNCFIFILIGLEFRLIIGKMPQIQFWIYSGYSILITIAIVVTRFIFIYIKRGLAHLHMRKNPVQAKLSREYLRHATLTSWAGMRGIVSLTTALTLPFTLPSGMPLEGRDVVIFLTFEIIFLTLVIPGLTLPLLIKWLKIKPSDMQAEVLKVRKKLAHVAQEEISRLYSSKELDDEDQELISRYFNSRHEIMTIFTVSEEHKIEKARHHILQKQRDCLMEMWMRHEIDDNLLTHLERELDIEDVHSARGIIS